MENTNEVTGPKPETANSTEREAAAQQGGQS